MMKTAAEVMQELGKEVSRSGHPLYLEWRIAVSPHPERWVRKERNGFIFFCYGKYALHTHKRNTCYSDVYLVELVRSGGTEIKRSLRDFDCGLSGELRYLLDNMPLDMPGALGDFYRAIAYIFIDVEELAEVRAELGIGRTTAGGE